jgi:hypothetical protein
MGKVQNKKIMSIKDTYITHNSTSLGINTSLAKHNYRATSPVRRTLGGVKLPTALTGV